MKRKYILGVLVILIFISVSLNVYLYNESVSTKKEFGSSWKLIAQNSNDTIDFMRNINLNNEAKTEEGRDFLEEIQHRILYQLKSNFPVANDVLYEVEAVLVKAIEEGQVTEEDIKTYNQNLGIIDTIIYYFNEDYTSDMDWYKAFTTENYSNAFTKSIEEATK
ncbi:hypothetical protein [Ornithinibacillus halophilus]|uniref:Uncharacterized protein n=1 Tax=Ornithinibacillus halophilus TaxID=930117 RepID=A0A1M5KV17_9BACI|nr:hypothetical protein [Ornithinibacillus halophilus]SHG56576.1 hypothetical protein SAMN05216225_104129 [Ornithinibacillus halophilus]